MRGLSDRISWFTSQVGRLAVLNIEEQLCSLLCNERP